MSDELNLGTGRKRKTRGAWQPRVFHGGRCWTRTSDLWHVRTLPTEIPTKANQATPKKSTRLPLFGLGRFVALR